MAEPGLQSLGWSGPFLVFDERLYYNNKGVGWMKAPE